jgi:hypothetical protein
MTAKQFRSKKSRRTGKVTHYPVRSHSGQERSSSLAFGPAPAYSTSDVQSAIKSAKPTPTKGAATVKGAVAGKGAAVATKIGGAVARGARTAAMKYREGGGLRNIYERRRRGGGGGMVPQTHGAFDPLVPMLQEKILTYPIGSEESLEAQQFLREAFGVLYKTPEQRAIEAADRPPRTESVLDNTKPLLQNESILSNTMPITEGESILEPTVEPKPSAPPSGRPRTGRRAKE